MRLKAVKGVDMGYWAPAALLGAAMFAQAYASAGLERGFLAHAGSHGPGLPWPSYLILGLPLVAMCVWALPLPLFYLFSYLACLLPVCIWNKRAAREGLMVNARFMLLVAPHLAILGVLALLASTDVRGVLADARLRTVSLALVMLLNAALNLTLRRKLRAGLLEGIGWNSQELDLFSRFVWFCSVSVLLDSVFCLFQMPARLAVLFLMGSSLLVLLMAVLFAVHICLIARGASVREEYLRLRETAAEERETTARLEREAYLDPLTGAYTRGYALANITAMLQSGESFALAFLDLDGLKRINDTQGHLAGDDHLQRFSARLRASLRPSDVLARYGGDEFLVLMPGSTERNARQRMESLQAEAQAAGCGATPFSCGLVMVRQGAGLTAEEWVGRADKAMYADKRRDRARAGGC